MKKLEVQKRVTKNGKPLDLELFVWDEETKTFSSSENGLILDFRNVNYCKFVTGSYCNFNTGSGCTFDTGSDCNFNTGSGCTFDTGSYCTFDIGSYCNFKTGFDCTFDVGSYCIFKTGYGCNFKTDSYCTFDTDSSCTFDTGFDCTFKTGPNCNFNIGKNSVIVRKDVFEVIVLEDERNEIQLNEYSIKGYKVLEEKTKIVIDGKEIEISKESLEALKKSLLN